MKKILCALLAAVLLLTLCACGRQESATYNDAGYYEIYSINEGERILNKADFDSLGWTVFLQLNDDGSGVLDMDDGDVTRLTWKDGTLNDGSSDMPYVLAGGMLTLDLSSRNETFVMIFRKAAAPSAPSVSSSPDETPTVSGFADRFRRNGNSGGNSGSAGVPVSGGSFTPVSGNLLDCHVEILAAEPFPDIDGKDAVRFYFDFTNTGDVPSFANGELFFHAEEDGRTLEGTYASYEDDAPEYGNSYLRVVPGVTLRCIAEFAFIPDGGELLFTISDYDGAEITAAFDPGDLPGRPGERAPEVIDDPQFFLNYPAEGSSDCADYAVRNAELTASELYAGDTDALLRVYFDFTNRKDETSYIEADSLVTAYQDGVELFTGYSANPVESDNNYYAEVDPGGTVSVSRCWELRSDSPVEVVITDWWTYTVVCAGTFYLK